MMNATINFVLKPAQRKHRHTTIGQSTKTMDSNVLIQLIRARNEKGFHTLYDQYCAVLYAVLIKFVRRSDLADDLLQDTFVKIWKNIDAYDEARGTLYTWMLNIARNVAIDFLRSSSYKQQSSHLEIDGLETQLKYFANAAEFDTAIEHSDFRIKALRIESKYAQIIDMLFFYGWTQQQTAEILKLPLGTVKTRAKKGIALLRLQYQQ